MEPVFKPFLSLLEARCSCAASRSSWKMQIRLVEAPSVSWEGSSWSLRKPCAHLRPSRAFTSAFRCQVLISRHDMTALLQEVHFTTLKREWLLWCYGMLGEASQAHLAFSEQKGKLESLSKSSLVKSKSDLKHSECWKKISNLWAFWYVYKYIRLWLYT